MTLEIRVLETPENTGIFNTAIDVIIQKAIVEKISPPTILFTHWEPTVSLGILQRLESDVDSQVCKQENVHVVRRKSGGQAVYLDDEYIVYSVIAPRSLFPPDSTHLRKTFCESIAQTLHQYGIAASFYTPDNVVIATERDIRQIGNSGQLIGLHAVVIHGSIRYSRKNLHRMINVLKINGHLLHPYEDKIKAALASVDEYSEVKKEVLTKSLIESFSHYLGGVAVHGELNAHELCELKNINNYVLDVSDLPHYSAKGVCYLFLNGKNIVPELTSLLPYNKPSGT